MPHRTVALLIDDDVRLGALMAEYLGKHEIDVATAGDGPGGLVALRKNRPDLVLLDLMLPGMDGLEVCRKIRATAEWASLPVIMLTAKGEGVDKVVGRELGADDYLAKPFNPRELLARIRAVLRRAGDTPQSRTETSTRGFRFGGWTLEPTRRRLLNADAVEVPLTGGEYDLLLALVERANRVLTRDM